MDYICYKCGTKCKNMRGLQGHFSEKHPDSYQILPDGTYVLPQKRVIVTLRVSTKQGFDALDSNGNNIPLFHNSITNKFQTAPFTTWKCTECGVEFKVMTSLQHHIYQLHPKIKMTVNGLLIKPKLRKAKINIEVKVKCRFCFRIMFKSNLENHIEKVHEGKGIKKKIKKVMESGKGRLYQCLECCNVLQTLYGLRRHIATSHANLLPYDKGGIQVLKNSDFDQRLACPVCDATKSRNRMQNHIFRKHVRNLPLDFEEHSITISGIKKRFNKCMICGESLTKRRTLKTHLRLHHSSLLPYAVDENYTVHPRQRVRRTTKEDLNLNAPKNVMHSCPECKFYNISYAAFCIHLRLHHVGFYEDELRRFKKREVNGNLI